MTSVPTMSEPEVRDDPPFVLLLAQLAQRRRGFLEEGDGVAVFPEVAQRERQVVLRQGDGAAVVQLQQDLQGSPVQSDRLRMVAAAAFSRASGVEPNRFAV